MLDRDQCLRLLADDEIGRLAVIAGNTPAIFPVNYRSDGDTIVFRTDWEPSWPMARGPEPASRSTGSTTPAVRAGASSPRAGSKR